jgi:outer membrane protein
MNALRKQLALLALGFAVVVPAHADDWFVRAGATHVDPKSNNGTLAGGALATSIDSQTGLGLVIGRQLNDNLSLELLAATPFKHTVSLNGAKAVDFKHLPPTLSLVYGFAPKSTVNPFVGAGLNYTWTFDEREYGPVAGTEVKLGNSWGLAAQAGLAFRLNERWDVVLDARWIDINADVRVNGTKVGEAKVDPMVYGLHLGYRF